MSVMGRIRKNIDDVRDFGPAILTRHFGRLKRRTTAAINFDGYGPVHIRLDNTDKDVLRQVFSQKQYRSRWDTLNFRIVERYRAIIASGKTPVIVDAGANIGASSIWFAHEFPLSRVIAVEPDPENAVILRMNARPNIEICEAAIGAEPGHVSLFNQERGWTVRTERAESGVPVVSVANCISRVPNGEAFIVKVDIEGFESDLFASNTDWLEHTFAVFIEPHDWMLPGEGTSQSFQRAMVKWPFELFLIDENLLYVSVADRRSLPTH